MVISQPFLRSFSRIIPIIAVTVLLSACNTAKTTKTAKLQRPQTDTHAVNSQDGVLLQASQDEFEAMVNNVDIKSKILQQYASWKGVRYRLGGSNKRGIDCSGFVQLTFREQFGINLPRSSYEQGDRGKNVQRTKLRVGDLVMFHAGSTGRHVGIYLGNDQFVHASTRNGVMISKLSEDYWNKRFRGARRVLTAANVENGHS